MCTKLLFFASFIQLSLLIDPLVQLPSGPILGRKTLTLQNTSYFAFQGIPYAAPPVGELRFKPPQPPQNWTDTLNVTFSNVVCYQISDHYENESEDCLSLNVYTSKISDVGDLLPVMIFIHGGGFFTGSPYLYSPDYFVDHGVILVTFNYRLGVFGFLSTQDEVIPGNNGLKDQALALRWVYNNIEHFGGDSSKITIFGESAGGVSVGYHLLNQDSAGLFRGAILQSGSSLTIFGLQRNAKEVAYATAALLNDTVDESMDSKSLEEFLRDVDASALNAAAEQYFFSSTSEFYGLIVEARIWAPVIEQKNPDAFITKKMYDLLKAGNFLQVPVIIGTNTEESLLKNQDPVQTEKMVPYLDENLHLIVPDDMQISDIDNRTKMGFSIRKIYTGGENFTGHVGAAIRYASDNYLIRASIKHAELSSNFAKTYFYQFSYDGELGNISVHYDGAENVGHGEDLFYLFCFTSPCSKAVGEDLVTRHRLVKLWTNFAKYLNPTPEDDELLQNVIWPEVSTENGDFFYLDIGNDLEVKNHPKKASYGKWNNLYKSLEIDSFDTY